MTTVPVLKGKFGSTEYYVTRMKAREIAEKLVIPKELEEWSDMSIEERFQREINYKRVKEQIAPYLAHDEDRFFGALIVDIYNPGELTFESLDEVAPILPGLYAASGKAFGFLHFGGGEVLVPLDGQHRLAALRFAISGKDEKQKDIEGLAPNFEVAQDDLTVIFIKHDEKKARKIFNKVNRYAKATTKAENLITADDDIVAVIVREEIAPLIGERLINYQNNTLNKSAHYFTTLSTLYDASSRILSEIFNQKVDTTTLPSLAQQGIYRTELKKIWESLLNNPAIDLFRGALSDSTEAGDDKRREIRESFLLGKPIAQLSLAIAFMRLWNSRGENGEKLRNEEICRRLNAIDWKVDNPMWQQVLMSGDNVKAGRQAANFAGRFIAYLGGEPLTEKEVEVLRENYQTLYPSEERASVVLPEPVVEAGI